MNLPLFIASRIYKGEQLGRQASRPAVLIAMIGIAIGLAVMILSVAVIVGFKKEIREKIVGFGGHVQVSNLYAGTYETQPIETSDSLLHELKNVPHVKHVQRFSTKPGMLKTADAFQGVILKGVGQEYNLDFMQQHLVVGEIPLFSDTASTNKVLISQSLADKMQVGIGDKLDTYFMQENVRVRRLTIAGIYCTNFAQFDDLFLLTDLHLLNRLNAWKADQSTGIEIALDDFAMVDEVTYELADKLESTTDSYGERYCVQSIEQLNPLMFAWLDVLDVNIWVILALMIGVAGFTMISGLLIIIIERTSMIGVLKSLGADNTTIRRLFLWFAVFIISKGLFWGNLIGLGIYAVQSMWGVFTLDASYYYMDTVPMSLNVWLVVLLNVGTLLASVLMLIGPSYLITRIHPANSMRYE